MPQETKVFESTMSNGISYEIHEAQGFSDHTELAIMIEGQVAMVLTVEKRRSGTIEVRPSKPKTIRVRPPAASPEEGRTAPNVDDVLADGSPES